MDPGYYNNETSRQFGDFLQESDELFTTNNKKCLIEVLNIHNKKLECINNELEKLAKYRGFFTEKERILVFEKSKQRIIDMVKKKTK